MRGAPDTEARTEIVRVVEDLLMSGGYEGFAVREVARQAHVSLSRIYKLFGTREQLIVTAVEHWMAANGYAGLVPPLPTASVHDGLLHILRSVFEPWEHSPRMLEVFHRARIGTGGDRLVEQGTHAIGPAIRWVLQEAEPTYVEDVELLLGHLFYAVFGRFADGELAIGDVLATLERAAVRLTADNTAVLSERTVT